MNDYMTVSEAAQYARASTRTIRRWIAQGHLTAYRLGPKLIRLRQTEIDDQLRRIPSARG